MGRLVTRVRSKSAHLRTRRRQLPPFGPAKTAYWNFAPRGSKPPLPFRRRPSAGGFRKSSACAESSTRTGISCAHGRALCGRPRRRPASRRLRGSGPALPREPGSWVVAGTHHDELAWAHSRRRSLLKESCKCQILRSSIHNTLYNSHNTVEHGTFFYITHQTRNPAHCIP